MRKREWYDGEERQKKNRRNHTIRKTKTRFTCNQIKRKYSKRQNSPLFLAMAEERNDKHSLKSSNEFTMRDELQQPRLIWTGMLYSPRLSRIEKYDFFVKIIICYIKIDVRIFLFVLFCSMNYCVNWLIDSWFGWILVGIKFCLQGKPPGSAVAYRSLEG